MLTILSSKFEQERLRCSCCIEKPAEAEKLVNRGTANAMRCLELASGAPLNETERNAKTPAEANRECPSLVDPFYSLLLISGCASLWLEC
jgi:hypothetical protein